MMNSYEFLILFITFLSFPESLLKFDVVTIQLLSYYVNRRLKIIFLISC